MNTNIINTRPGDTCAIYDSNQNPIYFQKTGLPANTMDPSLSGASQIYISSYPLLSSSFTGANVGLYLSPTGAPPSGCLVTGKDGSAIPNLYNSTPADSCSAQYNNANNKSTAARSHASTAAVASPGGASTSDTTIYQQTSLVCPFSGIQSPPGPITYLTFSSDPVYGTTASCTQQPISNFCT